MAETKQRDVQVLPIGAETTVLRSRTWDSFKFEIESVGWAMPTLRD